MWGFDYNMIFKVTSKAVLEFFICFPVEHPYRFLFYVFFVTNWQTEKLTHDQLKTLKWRLGLELG